MSLNKQQDAAARRLGQDVCVVAGPGSGKTRVLIERFHWLVREQGVPPERILATTFTDKAATHIKKKLVEAFEHDAGQRQRIEGAAVSTIHGFCTRLLRENAVAAGVDIDCAVIDEAQSQRLLTEEAGRALDSLFEDNPGGMRGVLESLYVSTSPFGYQKDLTEALISVYEAVRVAGKNVKDLDAAPPKASVTLAVVVAEVEQVLPLTAAGKSPAQRRRHEALLEWLERARLVAATPISEAHFSLLHEFKCDLRGVRAGALQDSIHRIRELIAVAQTGLITEYFAPLRTVLIQALRRLDEGYRRRKHASSVLDFSDLEEFALTLLRERSQIRERIHNQFDYVLMDELQDTNPLQWNIINLVRRPERFFAVGDINQSIYGFRHADPDVFESYRKFVASEHELDRLSTNYRSRQEILNTVNHLLEGQAGIQSNTLTAGKEFSPREEPAVEVALVWGNDAGDAATKEARWIARRIRQLAPELPKGFRQIAVLCRTRVALKPIERELRATGIPCLMAGNRTLLETREVRDLVQLLNVIVNMRDEVSLAGVLRSPLVGIRDETLFRMKLAGGLGKVLLHPDQVAMEGWDEADTERLGWFAALLGELRQYRDELPPETLLTRAIDESGYLSILEAQARNNVDRFLARLREVHESRPRPPAALIEDLSWLRSMASEAEAAPGEAADAVQLLSVHGAKGLEFPVVFVAALQKSGSGFLDPICYSPRHGFGVKWREPVSNQGVGDVIYSAAEDSLKTKTRQEENRLLYVAMTRAEDRLILTQATHEKARSRGNWASLVRQRLSLDSGTPPGDILLPGSRTTIRLHQVTEVAPGDGSRLPEGAPEEEIVLAPPEVTGQYDAVVPVTQLVEFSACPRKYYLGRYLGFETGAGPAPGAEQDGSDPYQQERPAGATRVGSELHRLLAGLPVEEPSAEAKRLAEDFRRSELAKRMETAERREREFEFLMELDGVILRGQIDAWFEHGGQSVVVDYKTDRLDPDEEPGHLDPYRLQLRLYALAFERLTGRLPREALLYFLRSRKTIPVDLHENALAGARAVIRSFCTAQERLEFPLREGKQCRRCGFRRGLCPAGA